MHKFNLVENALDSLEHAIVHINTMDKEPGPGVFKRVILDLSHVAELLFKERLKRIHPAFVFSDVDKFPSANANTVTAADALRRLQKFGEVEFREVDQSALKNIRDLRNQIEHYEFSINEKEARVIIGSVLSFIFWFACDELGLDWQSRRLRDHEWIKLNQYAEFYEVERERVQETLIDAQLPIMECPMCRNYTFDVESEMCVLCGHQEPVLKCEVCQADYLYSDVSYGGSGICPQCEWDDGYAAANYEFY